tara:strand:+ start:921 stop:1415 length:495 start_codon:yes stop_codon:yes gene_type:complete
MRDGIMDSSVLKLTQIKLSTSANSTVAESEYKTLDNKINMTSDNREYYIAAFQDPTNPFGFERNRVFSQNSNAEGVAEWRGAHPNVIGSFVGKNVPAEIVTRKVPPYTIGERTLTTYTCVVLKSESIESVFRANGHDLSLTNPVDNVITVDAETGEVVDAGDVV